MSKSVFRRICKYNKTRNKQLVKLKYEALTENPFRFFRGTCHLFYEDLPKKPVLFKSPHTWLCGDMHLENFGSFRGENRLAYFDMNDFDESFLGPCLLDIGRCCTSVFLAAELVKLEIADCHEPVRRFLKSYAETLASGYIRFVQRESASSGVIKNLMETVAGRDRKALLDKHVDFKNKGPKLKIDGLRYFDAEKHIKNEVKQAVEQWAEKNTHHPEFFDVSDVAIRVIGTGSIGIDRYLVLVNGKGGADGYHLLDIKETLPSSALLYHKFRQPRWSNEAERLIATQRRVQASTPAFLNPVQVGKKWFVMKSLQPIEDKVDFAQMERKQAQLTGLLVEMGSIVAWNNLRSGGRQGSAIADEMIRFGEKLYRQEDEIMEYAENYAAVIRKYYKEFKQEYAKEKK